MPARGHPENKYVRKIHIRCYPHRTPSHWRTACGKTVLKIFTTRQPARVTCKTCRRAYHLPPLEDPR